MSDSDGGIDIEVNQEETIAAGKAKADQEEPRMMEVQKEEKSTERDEAAGEAE